MPDCSKDTIITSIMPNKFTYLAREGQYYREWRLDTQGWEIVVSIEEGEVVFLWLSLYSIYDLLPKSKAVFWASTIKNSYIYWVTLCCFSLVNQWCLTYFLSRKNHLLFNTKARWISLHFNHLLTGNRCFWNTEFFPEEMGMGKNRMIYVELCICEISQTLYRAR
jgi:hypothetical protein